MLNRETIHKNASTTKINKMTLLAPNMTPIEFSHRPDCQETMPDGAGLQILFQDEDRCYTVVGPRAKKVMTANGGKIDNSTASFLEQLQKELDEETFGFIQLVQENSTYKLRLNGVLHELTFQPQVHLGGKEGEYLYVTFTAICKTVHIEDLLQVIYLMSPIAHYWSVAGNLLHQLAANAPKDSEEVFAQWWQSAKIQAQLQRICHDLAVRELEAGDFPPQRVLSENVPTTCVDALDRLKSVPNYATLMMLCKETVGRYSERAGYFLVNAWDLLRTAQEGSKTILDINGKTVADEGLFNTEAVLHAYALIHYDIAYRSSSIVITQGISWPLTHFTPKNQLTINKACTNNQEKLQEESNQLF